MLLPFSSPTDRLRELERLVRREQDRLYRFALFRTGVEADAQDAVQEVLLRLLDRPAALPGVRHLGAYVYRALAHECQAVVRRRQASLQRAEAELPDCPDEADPALAEYDRIRRLLSRLPQEQAEAIALHAVDGMTFAEAAELAGVPVSTMKSRFVRGIERMRELLKKENKL